jgi:hypothetical protein
MKNRLMNSWLRLVLAFYVVSPTTCSEFGLVFGTEPELSTHKVVYFGISLLTFGLLIDVSLILVLFAKFKKNYIKNHIFIALLIILLTLGNIISFAFSNETFYKNDLVLAVDGFTVACFMLQMLLGYVVRIQMLEKTTFHHFYTKRRIHAFNGLLIYFVNKIKLFYLAFYVISALDSKLYYLLFPLYVSVLGSVYLIFISRQKNNRFSPVQVSEDAKLQNEELIEEIIGAIENYECAHDETLKSVSSITSTRHSGNNVETKSKRKVKWFAYEDSIFAISTTDNPEGSFFFDQARQNDMTFIMHGKRACVVYDTQIQEFRLIRHPPPPSLNQFLNKNFIGVYARSFVFVDKMVNNEVDTNEKTCLNLFVQSNRSIQAKDVDTKSIKIKTFDFACTKTSKSSIAGWTLLLVNKAGVEKSSGFVDLKSYWIKMVGKYFMLEFSNGKKKFAYGVLSLNPNFLKLKAELLAKISDELFQQYKRLQTPHVAAISKIADNTDDMTFSHYYPVFLKTKTETSNREFTFSAPIGLGLGFTPYSTEKYVVIAKNEGILPFLDLFEILYQKYLLDLYKMNFSDWIFGSEYRLTFTNGLVFTFLWIIDDFFMDWAKSLGLHQLQSLLFLQSKLADKSTHVLKEVWIDNADLDGRLYPSLRRTITHEMNLKRILSVRSFDYDRIIISGDDAFKQQLFVGSRLDPEILNKVKFV